MLRTSRIQSWFEAFLLLAVLACTAVISPAAHAADVDEANLAAFSSTGHLRWDNIEGKPMWLAGCPLKFDRSIRQHVAQLQPGGQIIVHLPAFSMLRVASAGGAPLLPDDVEIWVSNGTGLYRSVLSAIVDRDGSLIAVPDSSRPTIIRVERPETSDGCLSCSLFVSRRMNPKNAFDYPCEFRDCGEPVRLADDGRNLPGRYYSTRAGRPSTMRVDGPARIRFQTRIEYEWQEAQSLQAFQLHVETKEGLQQVLNLTANYDSNRRLTVNAAPCRLSREAVAYWDVPAGRHEISVTTTADSYVRTTSAPSRSAMLPNSTTGDGWRSEGRSIWDLTPEDIVSQLTESTYPAGRRYRLALRSARDNRYADGGVLGWNVLRRVAAQYPGHPVVSQWGEQILRMHTHYRQLLPTEASNSTSADAPSVDGIRLQQAAFAPARLVEPGARRNNRLITESLVDDALGGLTVGQFAKVEASGYVLYRLPNDSPASRLRLAIPRHPDQSSAELMIQYDDGLPFRLKFCPSETIENELLEPTAAHAGQAILHWRHKQVDGGTLGGAFAARHSPAEMVDVSMTEINIPARVTWVRVTNPSFHELQLCVHHRVSSTSAMSERSFLEALGRTREPVAALTAILSGVEIMEDADPDSFRELANHYHPLRQLLVREYENMNRSLIEIEPPTETWDGKRVRQTVATARRHMVAERWMDALATWTTLVDVNSESRGEAVLGRITALQSLDESYLALVEMRGRALHDPDETVRRRVFQLLFDQATQRNDLMAQRRLAAAAAYVDPDADRLTALANVLSQQGSWSLALMTTLAIEVDARPAEVVARCAYHMRWWKLFEETLRILPSEPRNYWTAVWLAERGAYVQATRRFEQGGAVGQASANLLKRANNIVPGLRSRRLADRVASIRNWENWQAAYTGPTVWSLEPSLVTRTARTETMAATTSPDRMIGFHASDEQPLQLTVQGPAQLRLEVRPLHDGQYEQQSIDDWLTVRSAGRKYIWAIAENRPSPTVRVESSERWLPGTRELVTLSLGPGRHVMSVSTQHNDVIVRPYIARPTEPLPILPPLTPAVVDAVLAGRWGSIGVDTRWYPEKRTCLSRLQLLANPPYATEWGTVPFVRQSVLGEIPESRQGDDRLTDVDVAHLALRATGEITTEQAISLLSSMENAVELNSLDEYYEVVARSGLQPPLPEALTSESPPVPDVSDEAAADGGMDALEVPAFASLWQAMLIHQNRFQDALSIQPGRDPVANHLHASILLYLSETTSHQDRLAIRLADLARKRPHDVAVVRQVQRLLNNGQWKLSREVESSDGMMAIQVTSPGPDLQSAHVRYGMARKLSETSRAPDYLLSGYRRVRLNVTEPQPVEFELAFRKPQIGYLQSPPLEVEIKLNGQEPQRLSLDQPDEIKRVRLKLHAGKHEFSIRIRNPYLGQYVFVHVDEVLPAGQRIAWSDRKRDDSERFYHVATTENPVRFRTNGPSWLRVERWVDGSVDVREMSHVSGEQDLVLLPPEGHDRALFRIWEFQQGLIRPEPPVYRPDQELAQQQPSRWLQLTLQEGSGLGIEESDSVIPAGFELPLDLLESASLTSPDAGAPFVQLDDAFELGGQEDGTWGIGFALFHRRPLEEGLTFGAAAGRFLHTELSHRKFDPLLERYVENAAILRFREMSGPTFGLRHQRWYRVANFVDDLVPGWLCNHPRKQKLLDHLLGQQSAYFYAQRPSDALPWLDERTEVSMGARHRWSYRDEITQRINHTPALSVYGRWLSLDSIGYLPGRTDQDLFTPFKSQHRVGWNFTDTWAYQANERRRVWMRPGVYTNEDLNPFRPDHVSIHTGLSFLWRNLDVDMAYRIARYYEDDDRPGTGDQHLVYLQTVFHKWQHSGQMYEVDFNVNHDVNAGDTNAYLSFTRFFSNGRGYTDFQASQVAFRDLRERHR